MTQQPALQTRTQRIALAAFNAVEAKKKDSVEAEYRTLALAFPTMILQSGLAQAIGFLKAKNKPEHQAYLADLVKVLKEAKIYPDMQNAEALHHKILHSSVQQYQLLTRLLLDVASWLKRYTQALLEKTNRADTEMTP